MRAVVTTTHCCSDGTGTSELEEPDEEDEETMACNAGNCATLLGQKEGQVDDRSNELEPSNKDKVPY